MWIEAIVMPREELESYRPLPQQDRRALYEACLHEGQQFRQQLLNYLQTHQLMDAVKWVSEPGSLPMVTLRCHEQVLNQLRQAPEFEAGRSLSLGLQA
jgi:hypothetical protein